MVVLRNVLRVYSYIFEAVLCLMAVAVALVSILSRDEVLRLAWLPWDARHLPQWLLSLGLIGLFCVLLAAAGRFRWLLFVFSLAALVILFRGMFLGSYTFPGESGFKRALLLLGGALLAAIGAWPVNDDRRERRR